jgi:hypothetical protein
MFRDGGQIRSMRLVESQATSTGALILTYAAKA